MGPLTVSQLIANRLAFRLSNLQALEANMHRGTFISTSSPWTIKFPYQNWLSGPPVPLYYQNGVLVTPDVSTDLTNGTATFTTLDPGDNVDASYSFSYFSTAQLTSFFLLAMATINNQPPASFFTLDDPVQGSPAAYPPDFESFLTNYAYKCCLETVLMDMMTWKARLIFTDPQYVATNLQSFLGSTNQVLAAALPLIKGRRFLGYRSTSVGTWKVPATVGDFNFQQFTTMRGNGQ